MRRTFVLLVILIWTLVPGAAAQEVAADALTRPDVAEPTPVYVDLSFDVISVDERTESFEVEARLSAYWYDQRLAYPPSVDMFEHGWQTFSGEAAAELLKTRIWWPYFEVPDGRTPREQMNLAVEIEPDGWVEYIERFSVVIGQSFDLRDFPWDSHYIQFSVESFRLDADEVVFVADTAPEEWTWDEIREWDAGVQEILVDDGEEDGFSTVTALVGITRRSGHYVRNIILPLILIIFMGSAVFWMNLETMHLGDRLSVSLTSLLTVVAFDFVTNDGLPKLGYATRLDDILTFAYVFSAVAIAENVRVSRLHGAGKIQKALSLDRFFRLAYPVAFLLAVSAIWGSAALKAG